uniref:uncharacterized protein LOC123459276 isoform X2 n=1 Tax=Jaculus jaculus TaxID=51337 RepID=UPI001E1B3F39|nr:uncharacterized protein LOC123459276 isoform X2 [Jaculus jaculus]
MQKGLVPWVKTIYEEGKITLQQQLTIKLTLCWEGRMDQHKEYSTKKFLRKSTTLEELPATYIKGHEVNRPLLLAPHYDILCHHRPKAAAPGDHGLTLLKLWHFHRVWSFVQHFCTSDVPWGCWTSWDNWASVRRQEKKPCFPSVTSLSQEVTRPEMIGWDLAMRLPRQLLSCRPPALLLQQMGGTACRRVEGGQK